MFELKLVLLFVFSILISGIIGYCIAIYQHKVKMKRLERILKEERKAYNDMLWLSSQHHD